MSFLETVKRANLPGAPEDSVRLRLACTGAVLVAIAACAAERELSRPWELASMALVAAGMAFSYRTRRRPPGWVKVAVAVGAVFALVWFFEQVTGSAITDITTVENPLTVLFVWIQVVHSFHVPSRRDLLFSIGASAALMAVAAAQAIDLNYGVYALAWVGFGVWSLIEMWASASGGGRVSVRALSSALVAMAAVAGLVFLLLPAPTVGVRIGFEARAGAGGSVGIPGALAGDGGSPVQLSRPGSPSGPTRVGGFQGFANTLDTALRGQLGNTVVMRVRAQRPSYWVGETFDAWDGQSWTSSKQATHTLQQQSPFYLPVNDGNPFGPSDLQTFFVTSSSPDLVFHAETAHEVWFPTSSLFYSEDGTIVSPIGLGKGAIYSVESDVSTATPLELRLASAQDYGLSPADRARFTNLPRAYPAVTALAQSVTAGIVDNYDKVQALIAWMGANTRYSTDIPPLPTGADTVDEFLFGNRTGFCEQISTSLAVMLRTLGIPVREVVGYVPGPYNPITDLYEVQAKDAHAWVQVYFPGDGWVSFDPTASVPQANPSPGTTALKDFGKALAQVPPAPIGAAAGVVAAAAAFVRWRRRRPSSWAEKLSRRIERAGRRAGRSRRPSETIGEYAGALDGLSGGGGSSWRTLAAAVDDCAYGGYEPTPAAQREILAAARRMRVERRRTVRV